MSKKDTPQAALDLDQPPSLEAAITELEAIVAQMESGQLALADSIKSYERGSELLKICQSALTEIEQKVQILDDSNQLKSFQNE